MCNLLRVYLDGNMHVWAVVGGNAELVTSSFDLFSLSGQTLFVSDKVTHLP